MTSGNTDGKGRTGVLEDLAAAAPTGDAELDQPLRLLVGTMIVLSAEIKFLPLKGRRYYLYEHEFGDRGLYLALIAPWESYGALGTYIGSCEQRADCLWEVELERAPSAQLPFSNGIAHGIWHDNRFGYYNQVLAFHATKRVKLLPAWTRRALGAGVADEPADTDARQP